MNDDRAASGLAGMSVDYRTQPDRYRHWHLSVVPPVARLVLDVDENAGLRDDYTLKLNSYDLGVDIELNDAVQRLRFEHPDVRVVVIESAKPRVFCAGANIGMLAGADHGEKVNFCKFTNETRNAIEDATTCSDQRYICAIRGTAAGGGYELALATDYILLVDDGSSSVSLPEVPLLAVLPGTGGLTRLVDKRCVRPDHADFFCTTEEGMRGRRALEWGLVDELVPTSKFDAVVAERADAFAESATTRGSGIELPALNRTVDGETIRYSMLAAELDRTRGIVSMTLYGPAEPPPADSAALESLGAELWSLALAREMDDLILHLRSNEPTLGTWVIRSRSGGVSPLDYDHALKALDDHWLACEIVLYWKRVLKRLDVTSRSLITLVEPGSCFDGTLLELVLAADRSFMLAGELEGHDGDEASVALGPLNFGSLPTVTGLTRLQRRHWKRPRDAQALTGAVGKPMLALEALQHGLVTFAPDDIDWDDEVRVAIEARASFSADALTAMEANLRFPGPETMESKIFARLSAWQNWIFQRANAVGESGAVRRYGSGLKAEFDKRRV